MPFLASSLALNFDSVISSTAELPSNSLHNSSADNCSPLDEDLDLILFGNTDGLGLSGSEILEVRYLVLANLEANSLPVSCNAFNARNSRAGAPAHAIPALHSSNTNAWLRHTLAFGPSHEEAPTNESLTPWNSTFVSRTL